MAKAALKARVIIERFISMESFDTISTSSVCLFAGRRLQFTRSTSSRFAPDDGSLTFVCMIVCVSVCLLSRGSH